MWKGSNIEDWQRKSSIYLDLAQRIFINSDEEQRIINDHHEVRKGMRIRHERREMGAYGVIGL